MSNKREINLYIIIPLITLLSFCCTNNTPESENKMKMSSFNTDSKVNIELPKKLQELSGLTMTPDGRLFGHDDERAIIYQINQSNGSIIKSFSVGKKTLRKDFEGIAFVNDLFYLVASDGQIYEFPEGEDKSSVSLKKYKTKLSSDNDVEGLCYDPDTKSLLLACKGYPGNGYDGKRAVYSFSLSNKKLEKKPRFLISIEEVSKLSETDFTQQLGDFFMVTESKFAPSGIEKNSNTGSFYILASQGKLIVEISSEGKIISKIMLDKKHHNQPEGITFDKDRSLLIGDEGGNGKAKITIYPAIRNK
jgi:uncharacterized protein YjiK